MRQTTTRPRQAALRIAGWFALATALLETSTARPEPPRFGDSNKVSDHASIKGDSVIRAKSGPSEIVITTTNRLAGAIHSLRWNGKEFIDSHDHGRQLQSAASFDRAAPGEFWAECYNPTEAGSRADGVGETSSSQLLQISAEGNALRTSTRMAFWLAPGEKSSGRLALNSTILSDHLVSKRVRIGGSAKLAASTNQDLDNVVEYEVTFTVPRDERHTYAQFEALTGYMPSEFSRFWKLPLRSRKLDTLDDGPGEQAHPVIFSNASGSHAMGIFSPDQPSRGFEQAGYGRFRFEVEKVVKWNCVFRLRDQRGIAAGPYRFRQFVAVGSLQDVQRALETIFDLFPEEKSDE
jgi:hypothetical protein